MKSLPLLFIWGVWLARNNEIFVDKSYTPAITATLAGGIQTGFPQHIRVDLHRTILEAEIDKSAP